MVLRKQNEIEEFIRNIDRVWSLSIVEEGVLDSILNLFLAGENTEIKKVEHLLNDETEELLELLNERDIIRYAENELDLISNQAEDSLVDALEDLNFKWSNKVDIDDMISYLENEGYNVDDENSNFNIITQSQLEELTDLFLSADLNKRQEIINNLK